MSLKGLVGGRLADVLLDRLVVRHGLNMPGASIKLALSGYSRHCPTPLHRHDSRTVISRHEVSSCSRNIVNSSPAPQVLDQLLQLFPLSHL